MIPNVRDLRSSRTLSFYVGVATLCVAALCLAGHQAHAAEANEWTTTELGITITQTEILDAFDGCSEFWPAVCRHIEKRGDEMASDSARSAAVAIIRQTQLELHKHFFETDEQGAHDVLRYTAWALRRGAVYHQAAKYAGDRPTMLRLHEAWLDVCDESENQSLGVLEEQMLLGTDEVLAGAALETTKAKEIRKCARQLAACVVEMQGTNTAAILLRADRETKNDQIRTLLRNIVEAADWASLTHADNGSVGVTQFKAAWEELTQHRDPAPATALK